MSFFSLNNDIDQVSRIFSYYDLIRNFRTTLPDLNIEEENLYLEQDFTMQEIFRNNLEAESITFYLPLSFTSNNNDVFFLLYEEEATNNHSIDVYKEVNDDLLGEDSTENEDVCPICLGGMNKTNSFSLECSKKPHQFHKVCLQRSILLNDKCPMCRCIIPNETINILKNLQKN